MPESDQRPDMEPVDATEALLADMPLPSDAKTFFLGGIFVLAWLAAACVASDIVLPLIFAILLNLLMQPAMSALERLRVPRALGSILLILVVFATIVGVGAAVSGPAEAWIAKLPEGIPRIEARLRFLDAPIHTLQTFLTAATNFGAAGPQRNAPGPLDGGAILSSVFAGTRSFAGALFTTVMFLYFLLLAGDGFLRRLVEVLPRFASKRQAVEISQQIGRDISAYLLTITIMNTLVGAATALVMWSTGVGDPVLWGTVAFILNYVPILGPAAAFFIFLFAGALTIDSTWQALLPAALYAAIHVVEGETATPMLLARRFTLNPVLVVVSFAFWFWLWGVPGAILSAPILATAKIVCDRIRPLAALGHILAA
ncbi:putative PurR-regulated permease PerM [Roseiarcus fermentans]|uniref:Putative PurR-regulated permease PerM n=1 Tax=Roseiarcus fermentans TaxID=1473586 RepID=A0A366FUJ3_9HYPH|nr:AI-2E family transporter [Roseiarcus fermentans]RBP18343.1 putative PurR-regulated permease PerM [Roseiarcus fermentans]